MSPVVCRHLHIPKKLFRNGLTLRITLVDELVLGRFSDAGEGRPTTRSRPNASAHEGELPVTDGPRLRRDAIANSIQTPSRRVRCEDPRG
jgi:hypothetical protein